MLTRAQYIVHVAPIVADVIRGSKVFPETIISQSIVESQKQINGIYYPGQSLLAKDYKNYFGIKAGSNWTGASVNLSTREETPSGSSYYIYDNFRVYNSLKSSFRDYVHFLENNSRYKPALQASNYKDQIKLIAKAGYATDDNYADVLISVANKVNSSLKEIGIFVSDNKGKLFIAGGLLTVVYLINKK